MTKKRREELSDKGKWIACFCGCSCKIFIVPLYSLETKCVVCFEEIKGFERSTKVIYADKLISIFHNRCKLERVSDFFPGPS